jgi:hypothetical protein
VEEFHGQFKIGGGKKKEVLLDWRGNEKKRRRRMAFYAKIFYLNLPKVDFLYVFV